MKEYNYDLIDGQKVPPLVINEGYELNGEHRGSIYVESGNLKIVGISNGSIKSNQNTSVEIIGKQRGSVTIAKDSIITVYGVIDGSVDLEQGSILIIEESGKLNGSLTNNGKVVLRGVFGGTRTGCGELVIEGNGYIKQPIIKDGVNYYR